MLRKLTVPNKQPINVVAVNGHSERVSITLSDMLMQTNPHPRNSIPFQVSSGPQHHAPA